MAVYCWGNTVCGELGLGGIEEDFILAPRQLQWDGNTKESLVEASCGQSHTLLLTSSGKIYSCGNNDHGQLGHYLPRKRPQLVSVLENYVITQISSGVEHSLALNEWGQVFSWGCDNKGQLAQNSDVLTQPSPKIIKTLGTKNIIQIASGDYHCLALSNSGDLYVWGDNSYGQLGIGTQSDKIKCPTTISSLAGIPIAFITAGANHSFAISKSGAVFGWGKNNFGQLGLNDEKSRAFPTQLKTLRSLGVRYITCGDDFSVFLTQDGGVFTCGSGRYGQLGHGSHSNEILPRMVMELMGSTITQVACGRRHTLALVPSRGRVYGFGLGCYGQLGSRSTNSASVPQVVLGPWLSPSGTALIEVNSSDVPAMTVKRIFSGGDQCLVSTTPFSDSIPPYDCRVYNPKTQIVHLDVETAKACSLLTSDSAVDMDFMSILEHIFKSQACINGSCLLPNFKHLCCTSKHHGVDIEMAKQVFTFLRQMENESLKLVIWDGVTEYLIKSLVPSPADVETLRIYLLLPLYHEFVNAKNYLNLQTAFGTAVAKLSPIPKKIVLQWWSKLDYFENLILSYKNVVLYLINFYFKTISPPPISKKMISYEPNLVVALEFLQLLHSVRGDNASNDLFHMTELTDLVDVQNDYVRWAIEQNPNSFHLCNYPFIFDAKAKTTILQTDQAIQMQTAINSATRQGFLSNFFSFGNVEQVSHFIQLHVTRENLVADTLREMSRVKASDLKKPLKVKFHDEEAEDAGGVRKEFFMLLLKDILDPKYGMFKEFDDSRAIWFSDIFFETEEMYYLIGIICGLAIYNFTIINLPFPLALYKKLLNKKVDISDLRDLSPTLANSMQSILDYSEDDIEDIFGLSFEITRDVFGDSKVEVLKPGGDKIRVNHENKAEFVDLYVDFIFNKSVQSQYNAFHNGFMRVCGGRVMQLFEPRELMAVVVGNEDYDWHALEAETEYKNGYTSGDQTIRWFWEVFHELPEKEKKKFLLYLTGSDRIPIQGMKAIKIIIQPTTDEKFLPVAHTCFNLLDLPRYSTKERLKYKLMQAIQQTQGFSLV